VREIMSDRHHFNEILKGLHGASPTILGERLRRLEKAGIVETHPNPNGRGSTYYLTPSGTELAAVVRALGVWGQQWLELRREHCDPDVLMWAVFTHLVPENLPARRQVVRFEFRELGRTYWLVLRRPDPDLCYNDPGFGDDVVVRGDLETLVRVYLGQLDIRGARAAGLVEVDGSREAVASLSKWFPRSGFAAHARPVKYEAAGKRFVKVAGA
jgi:DNA-binding HxlR family transcriptional regulator